mmetsp:Transcript_3445/g.4689  ORF Transcript_3445/g.4689 Transcript_3445/m.4689 type:complete len:94 (+) Transcript_3445:97-378(+)
MYKCCSRTYSGIPCNISSMRAMFLRINTHDSHSFNARGPNYNSLCVVLLDASSSFYDVVIPTRLEDISNRRAALPSSLASFDGNNSSNTGFPG